MNLKILNIIYHHLFIILIGLLTLFMHTSSAVKVEKFTLFKEKLKLKANTVSIIPCMFETHRQLNPLKVQLEWGKMDTEGYRPLIHLYGSRVTMASPNLKDKYQLFESQVANGICSLMINPTEMTDSGTYQVRLKISGKLYEPVPSINIQVERRDNQVEHQNIQVDNLENQVENQENEVEHQENEVENQENEVEHQENEVENQENEVENQENEVENLDTDELHRWLWSKVETTTVPPTTTTTPIYNATFQDAVLEHQDSVDTKFLIIYIEVGALLVVGLVGGAMQCSSSREKNPAGDEENPPDKTPKKGKDKKKKKSEESESEESSDESEESSSEESESE